MQTLPRRKFDGRADQPSTGPARGIVPAGRRAVYAGPAPLGYAALLVTLVALAVIMIDARGTYLLPACVVCAIGLTLGLLSPARALRWPLAAALVSVALLAFGAAERATVTLELHQGFLTVRQDGQEITAT